MHCNTRHKTRTAPVGEIEHGISLCRNRRGFTFHPDTGPHKAKVGGAQARLIEEFQDRARVANIFLKVVSRG